jgi:sugar lactone lactonase YvrE
VTTSGEREVITRLAPRSLPFSVDWLPDGRLLAVDGPRRLLMRLETNRVLTPVADLTSLGDGAANEIVVDSAGNAFVNGGDGSVVRVTPEGGVRKVADGSKFPNGMALLERDRTLVVADSHTQALIAYDVTCDGSLSAGRVWPSSNTPPTGSSATLTARSGSRPSQTSGASASAREVRSSTQSLSIAGASPACSAASTGGPCSSPPPSGAVWTL